MKNCIRCNRINTGSITCLSSDSQAKGYMSWLNTPLGSSSSPSQNLNCYPSRLSNAIHWLRCHISSPRVGASVIKDANWERQSNWETHQAQKGNGTAWSRSMEESGWISALEVCDVRLPTLPLDLQKFMLKPLLVPNNNQKNWLQSNGGSWQIWCSNMGQHWLIVATNPKPISNSRLNPSDPSTYICANSHA